MLSYIHYVVFEDIRKAREAARKEKKKKEKKKK